MGKWLCWLGIHGHWQQYASTQAPPEWIECKAHGKLCSAARYIGSRTIWEKKCLRCGYIRRRATQS